MRNADCCVNMIKYILNDEHNSLYFLLLLLRFLLSIIRYLYNPKSYAYPLKIDFETDPKRRKNTEDMYKYENDHNYIIYYVIFVKIKK